MAKKKLVPPALEAPAKKDEPTRRWWVGTLPSSPVRNLTLGGVGFATVTGNVDGAGSGRPGAIIRLTAEDVARVHDAMMRKVARLTGGVGSIADTTAAGYIRQQEDTPISKHVYMIPVDEAPEIIGDSNWQASTPPSVYDLYERGETVKEWIENRPETGAEREINTRNELAQQVAAKDAEIAELKRQLSAGNKPENKEPGEQHGGGKHKTR